MNRLITDLLDAHDLLTAGNALKEIDDFLNDKTNDRIHFCKDLSSPLSQWAFSIMLDINNLNKRYAIYSTRESIPIYLASHGLLFGKVRETTKHVKKLIEYIDTCIIESSGNCLSVEKAEEVIKVVIEKFPYFDVVGNDKTLNILNIDNTDKVYNSLCAVNAATTDSTIIMYNMKDMETSPEYVFLHELGHALQIALTKSPDTVPDEFIEWQQQAFPNALAQGNPNAPDVFADSFAIAVMHNTKLKVYNPFDFPTVVNDYIESYFKKYFSNYSTSDITVL